MFSAVDFRPGGKRVIMISDGLWRERVDKFVEEVRNAAGTLMEAVTRLKREETQAGADLAEPRPK